MFVFCVRDVLGVFVITRAWCLVHDHAAPGLVSKSAENCREVPRPAEVCRGWPKRYLEVPRVGCRGWPRAWCWLAWCVMQWRDACITITPLFQQIFLSFFPFCLGVLVVFFSSSNSFLMTIPASYSTNIKENSHLFLVRHFLIFPFLWFFKK